MISKDIQADTAIRVDVRVVDAGREIDLGWLKWIVGGEVYGKEENAA